MVLFPGGWPAGETVRFERIRIKGAFTVSATATGAGDKADGSAPLPVKLTSPVRIASLAGQNLTVAWWAGAAPTVKVEGGASVAVEPASCGVAATLGRPCYRFATAVGESYTLQGSASPTLKQDGDADLERSIKTIKTDDVPRSRLNFAVALTAFAVRSVAALDNGLALTPPRGWRSWNEFGCDINQTNIESQMEAMVSRQRSVDGVPTSLLDLGYTSAAIDDCWQACNSGPGGVGFHNASGYPCVHKCVCGCAPSD